MSVRRIVTGRDDNGHAVLVADEIVAPTGLAERQHLGSATTTLGTIVRIVVLERGARS